MKIKHKVQRKLDPTFQAELNLCRLCGPTPCGREWSVWGLRIGHGGDVRCTSDCWVRGGLGVSPSGLQWAVLCCSLRLVANGRDAGGEAVSSGSGAEHSTPQSACPPQKIPQASGSLPFRSEPCFLSARVRASFGFVFLISDCCAQDCESEKPPRSWFRCKHTRDYLQTQSFVQVYLTQQSRDWDPELGFTLVLRAGLGVLPKGWSKSSSSVYILIWDLQVHWDLS